MKTKTFITLNNMKKVFLALATVAMLTVGCSKDDNNETSGGGSDTFVAERVEMTYKLVLDTTTIGALRDGYDLILEYYDADGQIKSSTEITPDHLTFEKTVTGTTFPAWYGFHCKMTPKSDLSGLDEGAKFNFVGTFSITGACYSTNGRKVNIIENRNVRKIGIKPHNGKVYEEAQRYEVKSDGSYEGRVDWEE
jgi:hypothetical protein